MLLGVMTLEAKPMYRIETWVYNGDRYYLPQKKVSFKIKRIRFPFKVWQSGAYPFTNKSQAEQIIKNWKDDAEQKDLFKYSEFINVE